MIFSKRKADEGAGGIFGVEWIMVGDRETEARRIAIYFASALISLSKKARPAR